MAPKNFQNPAGMESRPWKAAKEHVPRLTLCELCDRTFNTQDWPAHKNSKKHRALEEGEKAKENKGTNGWGGDAPGFTADGDAGFDLAPAKSANDLWTTPNDAGWGATSGSGNTSGYGSKSGGGSGDRACFGCGEVGHNKRECPKGSSQACFGCGNVGHTKRECPLGSSGGGGQACFNCGNEGYVLTYDLLEPY